MTVLPKLSTKPAKILDLAPPDAVMTNKDNPRRCWMCGYYSFKIYGGPDSTSGKCFRDIDKNRKVYYVDGLMTCPGFIPDDTQKSGR